MLFYAISAWNVKSLTHKVWGSNNLVFKEGTDFSILLSKAHYFSSAHYFDSGTIYSTVTLAISTKGFIQKSAKWTFLEKRILKSCPLDLF